MRRNNAILGLVVLFIVAKSCSALEDQPAVSAQDLLSPAMFPNASFGMAMVSVVDGATARVITTGGDFLINKSGNMIECRQTITKNRSVTFLRFSSGTLNSLVLTSSTSGAAIFSGGGTTLRINCDSILMIAPNNSGNITADIAFTPTRQTAYYGNYNFFDPFGGVAFFEHNKHPNATLYTYPLKVVWPWTAGDVFWAGISPPKAYDWNASFNTRVLWHGSSVDRYMYPSDLELYRTKNYANILMLHNEMMWEHWQLSLVPRDMNEYLRVMRTAHELGMKVMVYTSPKAFLKGTVIEYRATPNVNDPNATGWYTGSNENIYLQQAARIINEFETDGLYFDEMYSSRMALATQYHLARAARELVGDSGVLCYHCTEDAIGDRHDGQLSGETCCPAIHAYFTMILKGEGEWNRLEPAYSRYILCTHNISNTLGFQTNDDRLDLTKTKTDYWLNKSDIRFFLPLHWFFTGQVELLRNSYLPRLNPALQNEFSEFVVGYYRFEEPNNPVAISDDSGNSSNGTLSGTAIHIAQVPAATVPLTGAANTQALSLSGSAGSCANIGNISVLNPGTQDFTLEAWIYPQGVDASGDSAIAGKWITGLTGDVGYQLMFRSGGIIDFRVRDVAGAGYFAISSPVSVPFNQWAHVAGVRRGSSISLYIDGAQVNTISWSGSMNLINSAQPFLIGAGRTVNENMFNGKIDEVRLTLKALDAAYFLDAMPISLFKCGDSGFLPGDLNRDCYLNMLDLETFAAGWLKCTDPLKNSCW